jgi:tetratricopeptide (TPR) repeat protein
VIAEICVRLDGIPLALELAAARVAVLPVEQILRLLTERFRLLTGGDRDLPRHQTLRAMLDWSYDLLDDSEKKLFARLSVFAGGWTLEAANEVCHGAPINKDDVVYVLIGLIEQSLVVAEEDGDRYRMLETVRQYAQDRLRDSGEEKRWRDRHLEHFLTVAEEAAPNIQATQQRQWLECLGVEHDNLRSALTWATGADAVSGLRLASACWRFWLIRGYAREGFGWLSAMLAAVPAEQPSVRRAKALVGAATLAWAMADYVNAKTLYEDALSMSRELGDQRGIAVALGNLGMVALEQGDHKAAIARHEEGLAIWHELGDRQGIARTLNALGNAAYSQGDRRARSLYEQSLAIHRELGNHRGIALSLGCLAMFSSNCDKDYSTARSLHNQALVIHRELGDRWGIAWTLCELGIVAFEQSDYPASRTLLAESLEIWRELADRFRIATSLEAVAGFAFATGRPEPGARLWGQAARLRNELGTPLQPSERVAYDRRILSARASFANEVEFDSAWQDGRAMALEQAIEYALQVLRDES